MQKCDYCFEYFSETLRQETNHRKHWFCCEKHRLYFNQGFRICQSCNKGRRKENQLVCLKCHKTEFKPKVLTGINSSLASKDANGEKITNGGYLK